MLPKKVFINENSDIATLLKSYHFITFLFGSLRIKIVDGQLQRIGKIYKIFAFVLTLAIVEEFIKTIYSHIIVTSQLFDKIVTITFITSEIFLLISYTILIFYNVCFNSENFSKLYKTLIKVDLELEIDDKVLCDKFKYKVFIFHLLYGAFKSFQVILNFVKWPMYSMAYNNFCCVVLDLELLHFMIEAEIVARRFELLGKRIANINLRRSMEIEVDFDIVDGIFYGSWKNDSKCKPISPAKILSMYQKLIDCTKNLNNCYGLVVILHNYFYVNGFILQIF